MEEKTSEEACAKVWELIKVDVKKAEYWDGPTSSLVLAYDYLKARATKEVPQVGENKKVSFG